MSFDDNTLRIIQILGVAAAVITAIITGIRYIHGRVLKDVDDYLKPCFDTINREDAEIKTRLSLLEQAYSFVKEFFMKAKDRNEKYGDSNNKHEGDNTS